MIKTNQKYKEKCKLQGDKLIVKGEKYTVNSLGKLPLDIAAFHASEKRDNLTLVFHGEWSPYSNFHQSLFEVDSIKYATAEHYIQYQKSILFGDMVTANKILRSHTALEAKNLSYSISGFNMPKWLNEGFEISAKGIRENSYRIPPLRKC